ncbi:MAG: hypothetical protein WAN48_10930 [Actinomycetes bacterium]
MSQQRRRKRAQERTYGHQPKSHGGVAREKGSGEAKHPGKPALSAKTRRHRKMLVILISIALAANLVVWLAADSWNIRWVTLTLSVIFVPVAYFILVNPEKDTGF